MLLLYPGELYRLLGASSLIYKMLFLENIALKDIFLLQYVSCSWDKTIRVWNAYRKPKRKHRPKQNGPKAHGSKDNLGDRRKASATGSEKKVGFVDTDRTDETEDNESKMTGTSDGAQSEEGAESFIDDEKSGGEE